MKDDVDTVLNQAVQKAQAAGHEVTGWTLQSGGDGYTAWLYGENEETQWCLFEQVEILPSAIAAAQWCLSQVSE